MDFKRQGILGGTFDPIHLGHIHIAYEAIYKLNLEKIIFMPSGNPPHKTDKKITSGKERYAIIKEAIKNQPYFEVSDYEINKNGMSYTYETLEYLNGKYKNVKWYFITGADCLAYLDKWKNVQRILDNCTFVVFKRSGFSNKDIEKYKSYIEQTYNKEIIYLDIPLIEISSTDIRDRIKNNKEYNYLLPEGIGKYIIENKFY